MYLIGQRAPRAPLGSTNLLDGLTELREALPIDGWFVTKGWNSRQSDGSSAQARGRGEGAGPSCSLGRSPHISACSPPWQLSEPHPFGFLWRLRDTGVIDPLIGHWQVSPPPVPLRSPGQGVGPKIPARQALGWCPWQPAPCSEAFRASPQ